MAGLKSTVRVITVSRWVFFWVACNNSFIWSNEFDHRSSLCKLCGACRF